MLTGPLVIHATVEQQADQAVASLQLTFKHRLDTMHYAQFRSALEGWQHGVKAVFEDCTDELLLLN